MSKSRERREGPWTREEFLHEATRSGGTDLAEVHEGLLAALSGAPPLEVRFNGRGPSEASYNVFLPGVKKELLRVRAEGKLQACVQHLNEAGQPETAAFYRERLGVWIPENAGGWPWLAKTVQDVDIAYLVGTLRAVADHLHST